MSTNLEQAYTLGQSIWLDALDRTLLRSGRLKELVDNDGLKGITSNPAIFEKAIAQSDDYTQDIQRLAKNECSNEKVFFELAIEDIRQAADILRPVFDKDPNNGFVSLEVSPHLSKDTEGTIHEAVWLWEELQRPNVMIKIPATKECLPAIRECIRRGMNINVTLLFGPTRYREVTDAYLGGLEDRLADHQLLGHVFSTASFFLSRIDAVVDPLLEQRDYCESGGQAAIASADGVYGVYQEIFGGERFAALRQAGGRPQRLLWSSTGVKDPAASKLKYVEALIRRDTIATLSPQTLQALLDDKKSPEVLDQDVSNHAAYLKRLADIGIDMNMVACRLEEEGLAKFQAPFDKLLSTIERAREAVH